MKPFLIEDKDLYLSWIVNTMAADTLAMQVARVSAAMVLTHFPWNNGALEPEGFKYTAFTEN